jgi:hypothetical protein
LIASSELDLLTLYIAIGNALRGDDGMAQRALELLQPGLGSVTRTVTQLTPELAAEIALAVRGRHGLCNSA